MKSRWIRRPPGGPGFVRAESKGRDWDKNGTGLARGRDEARLSRGHFRGHSGGPGFVRAVAEGFDRDEPSISPAFGRDEARPSRDRFRGHSGGTRLRLGRG